MSMHLSDEEAHHDERKDGAPESGQPNCLCRFHEESFFSHIILSGTPTTLHDAPSDAMLQPLRPSRSFAKARLLAETRKKGGCLFDDPLWGVEALLVVR